VLFYNENIYHHHKDTKGSNHNGKGVKFMFMEPLSWMYGNINEVCGNLYCPECLTNIGEYTWKLSKLSACPECDRSFAPTFKVNLFKMKLKSTRGNKKS